MNLFQGICFVLAASAFVKVFFGIFFHRQLYDWAQKHYESAKRPLAVNLLLIYALAMLVLVWAAVITSYVPYGWILAALLTLFSLKSLNVLFNWKTAGKKFSQFIERFREKLWMVDLLVGILGTGFLLMGLFLY